LACMLHLLQSSTFPIASGAAGFLATRPLAA